ncbi:MAG: ribosome-associated translation inhibitor RaiA [Chloroflexota bacterium]
MRTIVKGKNIDVSDDDRQYVEQKMRRVERLLDDRSEAVVELSRERHKSQEASRIVEVTLVIDGQPLRGVARASTYKAAVDEVVDKLERRAVDHKERPREKGRSAGARGAVAADAGTPRADGDATGPRIVKIKRFAIEPMFEEDAVERLEELEHAFYVFVNAETEHLAVLYKRNDGDYGLIEPTVGGSYAFGQVEPTKRGKG